MHTVVYDSITHSILYSQHTTTYAHMGNVVKEKMYDVDKDVIYIWKYGGMDTEDETGSVIRRRWRKMNKHECRQEYNYMKRRRRKRK